MTTGFIGSIILITDFSEDEGYENFSRNAKVEAHLFYESLSENSLEGLKSHADDYKTYYVTGLNLVERDELNSHHIELPETISKSGIIFPKHDDGWIFVLPTQETNLYLVIDDGLDFDLISPKIIASILFPFVTMFSILGFAFWYISKYIAKPIKSLSHSLNQFGNGDMNARVKHYQTEPIKSLSLGFNEMATQIQELVNDYRVLLGAIPHELRTPVARTKFALGLSKQAKTQEEHFQHIEYADGYLAQLEAIVDSTLSFSKLYSENVKKTHKFSLKKLIRDEINAQDVEHLKIQFNCFIDEVNGNPKVIRLAISNILRNAIKYAKTKVVIETSTDSNKHVICTISDDGKGIPKGERRNIFKPFYRLDQSRSRKTGNLGLGLAVVELISRKIDGSVKAEKSLLGGATICFKWDGLNTPLHSGKTL